jgi:hypothetical protein
VISKCCIAYIVGTKLPRGYEQDASVRAYMSHRSLKYFGFGYCMHRQTKHFKNSLMISKILSGSDLCQCTEYDSGPQEDTSIWQDGAMLSIPRVLPRKLVFECTEGHGHYANCAGKNALVVPKQTMIPLLDQLTELEFSPTNEVVL